jgi:hypothetical protein
MGDAHRVTKNGRLGVTIVIDIDASKERDQLAALGTMMCLLGVYRLSD